MTSSGPFFEVNVALLTQKEATDYRQELYNVIYNQPEIELEVLAQDSGDDLKFYKRKLEEVDKYLSTFSEKI